MRAPSARCLDNTVDLYRSNPGQDVDGGATFDTSTRIAAGVACSVQLESAERLTDRGRISIRRTYSLYFADNQTVVQGDLAVWIDDVGTTHNLVITSQIDRAGKATLFVVAAAELL